MQLCVARSSIQRGVPCCAKYAGVAHVSQRVTLSTRTTRSESGAISDGSWRFATYVWNAKGDDARLAPGASIPDLAAPKAPGGRYPIPSREDCLACHEGAAVPVLGVSALQLSPDRDPLALLELNLAQPVGLHGDGADAALRSLLENPSDFRMDGMDTRLVPGQPAASMLALRMRSRNPLSQMPPLGTSVADEEGIALIERRIRSQTH